MGRIYFFSDFLFVQKTSSSQRVMMMSPPVSLPAGFFLANSSGDVKQNRGRSKLICLARKMASEKVMPARMRKILGLSGFMALNRQMNARAPYPIIHAYVSH